MTQQIDHLAECPTVPMPPRFLSIVWKYRKTLLVGMAIGLLLGIVIAVLRPTTYTSTATLLFPSAPASRMSLLGGGGSGDLPSLPLLEGALMVPQPGTSAVTASLILESNRSLREVLHQLHHDANDPLDLANAWKLDDRETLEKLRENMEIKVGKQGELYVGFRDRQPQTAYRVASALVHELQVLSKELGINPAEQSVAFLEQQVQEADRKLRVATSAMLDFQRANHIVSMPDQARALAEQYAKMQSDKTAADLEASTAMRQVRVMTDVAGKMVEACIDPNPAVGNTLAQLYQQVTKIETELALLSEKLTAHHPDVQAKQAELQRAQKVLNAEIDRQLSALDQGGSPVLYPAVIQAAASHARAEGLDAALRKMQTTVERLPKQQAAYARLQAELEANVATVKLLRQELEKARIVEQSRGPNFVLLDHAELPEQPDSAGRVRIIVLLALLGLAFATLLPYREWFRTQVVLDAQQLHEGTHA